MRPFVPSILITIAALVFAFFWGGVEAAFICALLIVMEISFSFDNAVVNAAVLQHMNDKWRARFLTWGMLIAVFGMYYLFPILIVAFATGLSLAEVTHMALHDSATYSQHLAASHTQIAAFGGMFLLMVFFNFILDKNKKLHWLSRIEKQLVWLGRIEAVEIVIALALLLTVQHYLPEEQKLHCMIAGVFGVGLYVAVSSVTALMGGGDVENKAMLRSGLMGFIYLNILDASFSLDAVIGSFAISGDIVIIMLGLSAGAMFVRSLTMQFVKNNTLQHYVFLEHGAHWGIGALAVIMLTSILRPVPELITGLIGLIFILSSLYSSVKYNLAKRRANRVLH